MQLLNGLHAGMLAQGTCLSSFVIDPLQDVSLVSPPYLLLGAVLEKKGLKREEREKKSVQLLTGASTGLQPLLNRPECSVPLVLLALHWLGQAWTSPQLSPFQSGQDQYAVEGGLGGRGTMCYIDKLFSA